MSIVAQDLMCFLYFSLISYIFEHQNENASVIIFLRMAKLKTWGDVYAHYINILFIIRNNLLLQLLFIGQPQVNNCLFGSRLHINDYMHHISEFKKVIVDIDFNVESSINTTQLNTETVVAKPENYYLRFQIKNIDDIPDYNEEIGLSIIATIIGFDLEEGWYSFYCCDCSKKVTKNGNDSDGEPFNFNGCGGVSDISGKVRDVIRVQDETGSASFILFDRHVKDFIHHDNHWLM
uniref:Replication factor A C-terminal domain-containing protein n=1 Tax=Lactuca sativa TaxID=4236 RepID=A0A9R1WUD5_LACSA|nr:hypothetical protein LSAT_V11C900477050 [Lactuca sativa]